jgi:hypothetical protein
MEKKEKRKKEDERTMERGKGEDEMRSGTNETVGGVRARTRPRSSTAAAGHHRRRRPEAFSGRSIPITDREL